MSSYDTYKKGRSSDSPALYVMRIIKRDHALIEVRHLVGAIEVFFIVCTSFPQKILYHITFGPTVQKSVPLLPYFRLISEGGLFPISYNRSLDHMLILQDLFKFIFIYYMFYKSQSILILGIRIIPSMPPLT